MNITFLGTGTSHGVPVIGCGCRVCRSPDPKNRRTRSSLLLEDEQTALVIDTPQEFRIQALREGLGRLDGVCYTHHHADHVYGIDDLRVFTKHRKLPVYGPEKTLRFIREKFDYMFAGNCGRGGIADLDLRDIQQSGPEIGGYILQPVPVNHGREVITAYRAGPLAYVTDCSGIPPKSFELLEGVEVLIIGALRHRPHPTHFSVDEALAVIEKIGPRMAYFTHMCHDIDQKELEMQLPASVRPAYDGLSLSIESVRGAAHG